MRFRTGGLNLNQIHGRYLPLVYFEFTGALTLARFAAPSANSRLGFLKGGDE